MICFPTRSFTANPPEQTHIGGCGNITVLVASNGFYVIKALYPVAAVPETSLHQLCCALPAVDLMFACAMY